MKSAWHSLTQLGLTVFATLAACASDSQIADSPVPSCRWETVDIVRNDFGLPAQGYLYTVVAAGDTAMAVGDLDDHASLLATCDGTHWGAATAPEHQGSLRVAAFGNDTFLAAGDSDSGDETIGIQYTHTKSGGWTLTETPTAELIHYLVFGNGVFVARTYQAGVRVSRDGVNWEDSAADEEEFREARIFFDGTRFIAYTRDGFRTSQDGRTWSTGPTTRPFDSCNAFYDRGDELWGFCGNDFVAPGGDIVEIRNYWLRGAAKSDPNQLTSSELHLDAYGPLNRILENGDTLIALVGSSMLKLDLPGDLTAQAVGVTQDVRLQMSDMTVTNHKFIAVGDAIMSSEDGEDWAIVRFR